MEDGRDDPGGGGQQVGLREENPPLPQVGHLHNDDDDDEEDDDDDVQAPAPEGLILDLCLK